MHVLAANMFLKPMVLFLSFTLTSGGTVPAKDFPLDLEKVGDYYTLQAEIFWKVIREIARYNDIMINTE